MKLSFHPYILRTRYPFTISGYSRSEQTTILTEISHDGLTGYGEASLQLNMLDQTPESTMDFLGRLDLAQFKNPLELEDILDYVEGVAPGNTCAKAGVDIALHDLVGKIMGQPLHRLWGYSASKTPCTTMTIGIDTPEIVRRKTCEAAEEFKLLKVKLGVDEATDKKLIETVREVTDKPLYVDANQGWRDRSQAVDMIHWLSERDVVLVEQPMPKELLEDAAWVTERSPLPTIADESCQRLEDVRRLHGAFAGINIKLLKCTGLREARRMMVVARSLGMRLMIGCSLETSAGISAAAQLTPALDYADLDGNLLIANDCFAGMTVEDGKITLPERPGTGATKLNQNTNK